MGASTRTNALLSATLLAFTGCATNSISANRRPSGGQFFRDLAGPVTLIFTPDAVTGHQSWIDAILGAKSSISMMMFNLTDEAAIDALVTAAGTNHVAVNMIIDHTNLAAYEAAAKAAGKPGLIARLAAVGGTVRGSSTAFSITHAKAMSVDNMITFITAMNLTNDAANTRDFGLILHDPKVNAEFLALFSADWANALNNGSITPAFEANTNLVVSPVNSKAQLVALIDSANETLIISSENLGDPDVMDAMVRAAGRKVHVRVLVPAEDKNPNPKYNYQFFNTLETPADPSCPTCIVEIRVMPGPESPNLPYMHSKMAVTDGKYAYIGSVNDSDNSIAKARELGILFTDQPSINGMTVVYESDWAKGQVPEPISPADPTFKLTEPLLTGFRASERECGPLLEPVVR